MLYVMHTQHTCMLRYTASSSTEVLWLEFDRSDFLRLSAVTYFSSLHSPFKEFDLGHFLWPLGDEEVLVIVTGVAS